MASAEHPLVSVRIRQPGRAGLGARYNVRPYSLTLTEYFMRASEPLLHPDGSIDEPTNIQHVELHQLFFHNFSCTVGPLTLILR